jgi:glucose repression mediator protein
MLRLLSDPFDSQTWYLLGRAFMDIQQPIKAIVAYREAIWLDYSCPGYFHSLGVLYYSEQQHLDSLDYLSRGIRLNPYIPEAWYNLGVLASIGKRISGLTVSNTDFSIV